MAEEERRPKRSRFDQTEPEVKRSSRFDRRSRSPPGSPPVKDKSPASGPDPAAAAAAAAAKINASIQAKKGIQNVDVPPIRNALSPPATGTITTTKSSGSSTSNINGEMYIADGDYIRDIEVNDLRNRYTLTKGSTQKTIKEETGADVTTRGNYYPDKSLATAANPPLYLHVTSTTKDGLEKAVKQIEELMKQELPNLVDERRFRRREPEQIERDEYGRRKWPEERIPIELESIPGFNLRAQVVGPGGSYVKHVQQETRCRVQIKGRGSGFMEHGTGAESNELMYLHVAGPDPKEVERAKDLCVDLLDNVRKEYEAFKANPPPQRNYNNPYGNSGGDRQNSYGSGAQGYGGYGASSLQSPTTPAPPGTSSAGNTGDYAAQWAQYYGQDPYAQYGGYANYVAYAQQYYAQQQAPVGSASSPSPAPPGSAPPGPPAEAPPPPPPSGSPPAANGGYNSMPPPPGL